MNSYQPGDWLEHSDAPEEDKDECRRIMAGERDGDAQEYSDPERDQEEDGRGGAAGCVFAVAVLAASLFLAWALTQTGGAW